MLYVHLNIGVRRLWGQNSDEEGRSGNAMQSTPEARRVQGHAPPPREIFGKLMLSDAFWGILSPKILISVDIQ